MKIFFLIFLLVSFACIFAVDIRLAKEDEISWINQKYTEVQFQHARIGDMIALAQINSIPVGIGRLVTIDDRHYELAGIYVFEGYRNKKVASGIVEFLLHLIKNESIIFCIAFKNLFQFYQKFGFEKVINFNLVPVRVISKYKRCQIFYQNSVELLVKAKS